MSVPFNASIVSVTIKGKVFPVQPSFQVGPIALGGLSIAIQEATWDADGLELLVVVPDRDTGAPLPLRFNVPWTRHAYTVEDVERELREAVTKIVAHEVAELLLVEGRRRDPHGEPQPLSFGDMKFSFTVPVDEAAARALTEEVGHHRG